MDVFQSLILLVLIYLIYRPSKITIKIYPLSLVEEKEELTGLITRSGLIKSLVT